MTKDQELKAQAMLLRDPAPSPQAIASELNISYAGVLRLRRELTEAIENNELEKVMDVDKYVVKELANSLPDEVDAVATIQKISGLQALQSDFQDTAKLINTRLRSLLLSCEHPSELEAYSSVLCDLQNAFFNKNTTQVNIQNNMGGDNEQSESNAYGEFLGDGPGRTD